MKPAMYIFINKGLRMSPGKIAAQAGHAAVEAALLSCPYTDHHNSPGTYAPREGRQELWDAWRLGLHYAKYVMEARDSEHLRDIERYLNDRRFRTALIIDEGHTEIDPIVPTALGVALVDKDDPHTEATFSSFSLYKEPRPVEARIDFSAPLRPFSDQEIAQMRQELRRVYGGKKALFGRSRT
jgi:PTH2 family peptidyl-tRNA hydrolase